jgi:hypothetical protein
LTGKAASMWLVGLIALGVSAAAHAQLCPLDLVAQDESGHRNIPNYRYDATHTAAGYWQITDTNWRHYAPLVDIDLAKWPNALSAPEQLQGQVAGIMRAQRGCLPWVPYNARLRADLGSPHLARVTTELSLSPPERRPRPTLPGALFARLSAPSSVYDTVKVKFQ